MARDASGGDVALLSLAEDDGPMAAPVSRELRGAMQRWVLSVACVNFDLELGPDVEFLYPPLEISKEEKDNIAFSSFPDTTVFADGTLVFSWRIREVPLDASAASAPYIPDLAEQKTRRRFSWIARQPATASMPAPTASSRSTSYLYGYTFFLQRRDQSVRRGYLQKSLVILTHLPHVALFSEVVARLGPRFFEHGNAVLESFVRDVAAWPAPTPGASLELPVLGGLVHVALPHGCEAQNGDNARDGSDAAAPLLASVPQTSLLVVFHDLLPDLWRLWECMLLAEPLLVIGRDPRTTSEAVWHLVSFVRPVPLAGDFRPYFHIHDYDFRALAARHGAPPGSVLGTTNPFFLQTCAAWPHKLRLSSSFARGTVAPGRGVRGGGGPAAGFASPRRRRVSKDRALLREIQAAVARPAEHARASALLRRYFADLTERFLAPLHQYVATLIPASFDLSSPAEVPPIRAFQQDSFLAWLKTHPGPLRLRQRSLSTAAQLRQSLYADFLQSPNFSLWLQGRVAAAQDEQWQRRIAALAVGDVVTYGRTRSEVEAIDLFLRLREELVATERALARPAAVGPGRRWEVPGVAPGPSTPSRTLVIQRTRLAEQMARLQAALPADLQMGLARTATASSRGEARAGSRTSTDAAVLPKASESAAGRAQPEAPRTRREPRSVSHSMDDRRPSLGAAIGRRASASLGAIRRM